MPVPERLLVMARGYQYKDAAFVSTVGRGGNIDIRGTFAPPGIQSDSWIEVTHCPVGGERENLWFYRMPGSGLSIFTGVAQTFSTRGPRTGKDHLSPNLDTAHWLSAPGPGQELVRLNTGKLGGLGVRGKRISGRDLVAMGHMKCGQPPDVRDCRPDDVAARLHTECAGWNEKDPLKRFTDENRVPVLNEVIDRGVHICTKQGSDEIIRAASRRRRLLGLVH